MARQCTVSIRGPFEDSLTFHSRMATGRGFTEDYPAPSKRASLTASTESVPGSI